jgi:hypothetical protein
VLERRQAASRERCGRPASARRDLAHVVADPDRRSPSALGELSPQPRAVDVRDHSGGPGEPEGNPARLARAIVDHDQPRGAGFRSTSGLHVVRASAAGRERNRPDE